MDGYEDIKRKGDFFNKKKISLFIFPALEMQVLNGLLLGGVCLWIAKERGCPLILNNLFYNYLLILNNRLQFSNQFIGISYIIFILLFLSQFGTLQCICFGICFIAHIFFNLCF